LYQLTKYLIPISFVLLLISFWNRNNLLPVYAIDPLLEQAPIQKPIDASPFDIAVNNVNYQLQPLYDYELYGLVVSYEHHDGQFGLHKLWNDHINVADMCVVWSNNAARINLTEYDFWNGQFTCNVKTSSNQAWREFNMYMLSNNHLLTEDDDIRDQIESISIGDQIRIKGYLTNYSNDKGGFRGTSTTRLDEGNGACETIYVNEIEVIDSQPSGWRRAMYFWLFIFVGSLLIYIKLPYQPKLD
jgi:hypothetical protein